MKALSMYSGGCDGLSLAGSWVGIETVAFCESDPACRAVLAARHPGKPIFESDEDVTADALRAAGIDPGGIDIVMGGPPCQCASLAGKRLGDSDPRNRWPQFLRVVGDIRPRWALAENSPGLLSVNDGRLFGDILRRLAQAGYSAAWQCWGAGDVGAPHERERVFIVGYAERERRDGEPRRRAGQEPEDGYMAGEELADAKGIGRKPRRAESTGFGGEPGAFRGGALADAGRRELQKSIQPGQQEDCAEKGARLVAGLAGCGDVGDAHGKRQQAGVLAGDPREQATQISHHGAAPTRNGDGGASTGHGPQPGLGGDLAGLSFGMDDIAGFLESYPWPAPRRIDGPSPQYDWEPPRVAKGVPNRAARIKMVGNACPPQHYLPALWAIVETERRLTG